MHLKLDELISSLDGAHNRMVNLENVSDEELERLEGQFQRLKERTKKGDIDEVEAVVEDLGNDIEDK